MKTTKDITKFHKYEINQSMVARFEKQVSLFSNNMAVITKTGALSYIELNNRANIFANEILKCCKNEFSRKVYMLFEHDFQMIIGIIAILKSGNTYIPLDPSHPLDRLEYYF
jgi:non-ribosomal peptide synthetase component F